ncbi:MAG: zinc-binding dehydrogenase [Caldilineaceae bacterium]
MRGVAKIERGQGNVALLDVPEPAVRAGHVVIEVQSAGVCGTDLHIYHDEYPSYPPVILGHEVAGVIAAVGDGVSGWAEGERVTAEPYFTVCGHCAYCRDGFPNQCPHRRSIGSGVHGAFTRYVLVPALNLHRLSPSISTATGALTEPLACCVHGLEMTRVEPSDTVAVVGPGAIGLLAAQVVKAAGARVVLLGTAADEERLALGRSLGIDVTVNVQAEDALAVVNGMTEGLGADVVFECSGAEAGAQLALSLVRRRGRYCQMGLIGRPIRWDLEQVCFREIQVHGSFATVPSAWRKALRLLASGQVQTEPLVSHTLPITDWQEAFSLFEARKSVKILLTPQ